MEKLASEGKYYFLSRPRRFGKSLFLNTLREAFLGRKELFKGLYLYDNWDWGKSYPVIYISFRSGVHRSVEGLRNTFEEILLEHEKIYKVKLNYPSLKGRFGSL